jgi:hypothetical protein
MWKRLRGALNKGAMHDWSDYTDIPTVSTVLLRYLCHHAKKSPLIEPTIMPELLEQYESPDCCAIVRRKSSDHNTIFERDCVAF